MQRASVIEPRTHFPTLAYTTAPGHTRLRSVASARSGSNAELARGVHAGTPSSRASSDNGVISAGPVSGLIFTSSSSSSRPSSWVAQGWCLVRNSSFRFNIHELRANRCYTFTAVEPGQPIPCRNKYGYNSSLRVHTIHTNYILVIVNPIVAPMPEQAGVVIYLIAKQTPQSVADPLAYVLLVVLP